MCCGGTPVAPRSLNRSMSGDSPDNLVGAEGMTKLAYEGENQGLVYWTGPVTHIRYKASARRRYFYADNRDIPGLLQAMEGPVQAFSLVAEKVAQPA